MDFLWDIHMHGTVSLPQYLCGALRTTLRSWFSYQVCVAQKTNRDIHDVISSEITTFPAVYAFSNEHRIYMFIASSHALDKNFLHFDSGLQISVFL